MGCKRERAHTPKRQNEVRCTFKDQKLSLTVQDPIPWTWP